MQDDKSERFSQTTSRVMCFSLFGSLWMNSFSRILTRSVKQYFPMALVCYVVQVKCKDEILKCQYLTVTV